MELERIGGMYAERLKVPRTSFQRASMVENLVKAEAVDATTVKVTLSAPNSSLFKGLADTRVMLMPKEMDDIGYGDPMKFGGIGPYQMAEFTKDVRIRFKKFDGYTNFRQGEPWFDEGVALVIPDRASTVAAFAGGQVQSIQSLKLDEIEVIRKAKPDALLYTWIDTNWNHIRPAVSYQPFNDFRVRRAIFLALDYAAMADTSYGPGWGYQAALSPGFPEAWSPAKVRSQPGYNPETKAQDRADAAKLMAAAGYQNGKGIDFDVLFGTPTNDNAVRFQGQLGEVFPEMKVSLKSVDQPTFATQQAAANFKTISYGITAAPDAVVELAGQYKTGGSRNYGKYSNAELDGIINKAQSELDLKKRAALLEKIQQKFLDEWMPMWVIAAASARNMTQPDIGGYDKIAGTWFGYAWYTKWGRLHRQVTRERRHAVLTSRVVGDRAPRAYDSSASAVRGAAVEPRRRRIVSRRASIIGSSSSCRGQAVA